MPRRARIMLANTPVHIIQRGNNRQVCFASEQDFYGYIGWLKDYAAKYQVEIHAWVLMTNHVHLLCRPLTQGGIGKMMQSLGRQYVRYFNTSYKRTGTLWEGRYNMGRMTRNRLVIIMMLFGLTSCKSSSNEIVMCEGMEIVAHRTGGNLGIKADGLFGRSYKLNEINVSVELYPRTSRWYGSFGLYRPSGVDGLHLVLDEGVQHFGSNEEALEWLELGKERMPYLYTSNGLVLGWKYQVDNTNDRALSVQLWKFYVNGREIKNLAGSSDHDFKITYSNSQCQVQLEKKYIPSLQKTINGRLYSGKAIDLMSERNISAAKVERAIAEGEMHASDNKVTFYYSGDLELGFFWVMIDSSGRVVIVG